MVALAMLGSPSCILLDEPSTGMDPEAKRSMWSAIKEFKGKSSVLLTTHSMDEAEYLADNVLIMSNGSKLFYGSLEELGKK